MAPLTVSPAASTINYGDGIGIVSFTNQIFIVPDKTRNPILSEGGDSGAVVVDDLIRVVGLLVAGTISGALTYANVINDVSAALGVTIFCEPPPGIYLLSYKKDVGTAAVDVIANGLQGTTGLWHSTWTTGWTIIEPFVRINDTYLLSYKGGDGSVSIDRIKADFQGTSPVWHSTWSTGWTTLKPSLYLS